MNYKALTPGRAVPTEVNALIEIPKGGGSVKYEFDRVSETIVVDRMRDSSLRYPVNYGCIPHTLSDDGDPLDILVLCDDAIQTGTVIPVRPVGVLIMDDEKGHDVKIVAVPADHLTPAFAHIQDINDISAAERRKIAHFFTHYKDLESQQGKNSVVSGWKDRAEAHAYILKAVQSAQPSASPPPKP